MPFCEEEATKGTRCSRGSSYVLEGTLPFNHASHPGMYGVVQRSECLPSSAAVRGSRHCRDWWRVAGVEVEKRRLALGVRRSGRSCAVHLRYHSHVTEAGLWSDVRSLRRLLHHPLLAVGVGFGWQQARSLGRVRRWDRHCRGLRHLLCTSKRITYTTDAVVGSLLLNRFKLLECPIILSILPFVFQSGLWTQSRAAPV